MRKIIVFLALFYASFLNSQTIRVYNIDQLVSRLNSSSLQNGDIIELNAGNYHINRYNQLMTINKNIILRGVGNVTFTTNNIISLVRYIFVANAQNVSFENLNFNTGLGIAKLSNSNGTYTFHNISINKDNDSPAIYVKNANSVFVTNSKIKTRLSGIGVRKAKNITVKNSRITTTDGGSNPNINGTSTAAINIKEAGNLSVKNSVITGSYNNLAYKAHGIYLNKTKNTTIHDTCIYGGANGIKAEDGSYKTLNITKSSILKYRKEALWLNGYTSANMHKNCVLGNKAFYKPKYFSGVNIDGNYWESGSGGKDAHPLSYCPPTSGCTLIEVRDVFRNESDKNISTKISNKAFNLALQAYDKTRINKKAFNGRVCSRIADKNLGVISADGWKSQNGLSLSGSNQNYTVPIANKNSFVELLWKENSYPSCESLNNLIKKPALSKDNFALRPNNFKIKNQNTAPLKAGEEFSLDFYGVDGEANPTNLYDEILDETFKVNFKELNTQVCKEGANSLSRWRFKNGFKKAPISLVKSGSYEVIINDTSLACKDRYASIDCKDKRVDGEFNPNTDTAIGSFTLPIKLLCKKNFSFDAHDKFRALNDRNISTKIVGKPFSLRLLARDENTGEFKNFKGTICAKIVRVDGEDLSTWNKAFMTNTYQINSEFTINKASKNARVKLAWKENKNLPCPLTDEDNSTLSSDNFAIRPNNFNISHSPSTLVSAQDFNLNFEAKDFSNSNTNSFNETANTSFLIDFKEQKNKCKKGEFEHNISKDWSFKDGFFTQANSYSEIGDINITITDKTLPCKDIYASIDCKDKQVDGEWRQENAYIGKFSKILSFKPHHFELNSSLADFGEFTYLANEVDKMHAKLDVNISAKNSKNQTVKNYSKLCYGVDGELNVTYDMPKGVHKMLSVEKNSSSPMRLNISKDTFKNGLAQKNIKINFDRNLTKPINPFKFSIKKLSFANKDSIANTSLNHSGEATFYYGKVSPSPLLTKDNIQGRAYVDFEVFSEDKNELVKDFLRNDLYWYRINKHKNESYGKSYDPMATKLNKQVPTDEVSSIEAIAQGVSKGLQLIYITNNSKQPFRGSIHLKTQPWLWYVQSNNPLPYSHEGRCLKHPCIEYENLRLNKKDFVKSGEEFGGADVNISELEDKTSHKKGIKTYR